MVTISITDGDYRKWVEDLGKRFRQSQIKAAVSVNSEMLRFYWELGRDIVEMHIEERWGDNVIKNLSVDLQREIPNAHCFSRTNLYYTRAFYLLYSQHQKNIPQVEGEISSPLENKIVPQAEGQLPDQILPQVGAELFSIPWGLHKYIMDKCSSDPDKALFYVRQTLENGWSRAVLLNWMDSNLYERQGKAITNFKVTLPEANSDLAQEITKDPYNFAFAGITGKYNERKFIGYKALHNYRADNNAGNTLIGNTIFFINQNFTEVRYSMEEDEYEQVQNAISQFKEQLEED
jgi:hypothetical protein